MGVMCWRVDSKARGVLESWVKNWNTLVAMTDGSSQDTDGGSGLASANRRTYHSRLSPLRGSWLLSDESPCSPVRERLSHDQQGHGRARTCPSAAVLLEGLILSRPVQQYLNQTILKGSMFLGPEFPLLGTDSEDIIRDMHEHRHHSIILICEKVTNHINVSL